MKKVIHHTKGLIFAFFCLILGVVLLFKALGLKYNYNNPINIKELTGNELKRGKVVTGNVDSFVHRQMDNSGFKDYSGEIRTYISGNKEYEIYLVELVNGQFIQLMISNRQTKEELRNINTNQSVYFEGIIEKTPFTANYDWSDGLDENKYPNIYSRIVSEYVVKETDFSKNNNKIFGAIALIIISVIVFFNTDGIQNNDRNKTDIYKKYYKYISSDNNENELMFEKENLSKLMNDFEKTDNMMIKHSIKIFIGMFLLVISSSFEMALPGIVLVILGLIGIWRCFINSDNKLAVEIAKKYNIETTYLKILQAQEKVKILEELIKNKE